MKSVLVRRPAKVDVFESHSGAETMPIQQPSVPRSTRHRGQDDGGYHTVLHEDVHASSDEEVVVEHDESEGERQDIVAGSDLEKLANGRLAKRSVS